MGLKDLMDEQFNKLVITPELNRLRSNEEISKSVVEYQRRYVAPMQSSAGYWGTSNQYVPKDNVYIGQVDVQGLRCGYARITYSSDDYYEGTWKDNKPNGPGIYVWKSGARYAGNFKNGNPHGQGKKTYYNGGVYTGRWKEGKKSGEGTMLFSSKDVYEGEFQNDQMHG
jgi:hypothetical protein